MSYLAANLDWPLSKLSKMLSGNQHINISELTALYWGSSNFYEGFI